MDWNRVEGNWKQVKGKIKEKWGNLTDDDLTAINGKRNQLEGKTHLTLSTFPPALFCRRAFFYPASVRFSGPRVAYAGGDGGGSYSPCSAGTRGMNPSWGGKIVAPARDRQGKHMRRLACGLVLTFAVVGSGNRPRRPLVRLLRFIDVQLWFPQLRTVLRHDLWERRVVPTQHFRAIRPKSTVGPDASPCPLLRACAASKRCRPGGHSFRALPRIGGACAS